MIKRQLPCQVCQRLVPIRSTVRAGTLKGKKVCTTCKPRQKTTKATFFKAQISTMALSCDNCGCRINVGYLPSWNIAHILSKRHYKSVAEHKENTLTLCSSKDIGSKHCHEKFDSSIEDRVNMPVFKIAMLKFAKFRDECVERGKEFSIFDDQ